MVSKAIPVRIQAPKLIRLAEARAAAIGCEPRRLCNAILIKVFEEDLVAAVLDGDDPNDIAPRFGAKAPRGMRGPRQQRVLDWAIRRAGPSGTFTCSFKAAAKETGLHIGQIGGVVRGLTRRGEITVARAGHRSPSVWTIPQHLIGGAAV
jgi:hypothetical protein